MSWDGWKGVGSCHRIIGVDIITETRPKPRRLMEAGLGVPELGGLGRAQHQVLRRSSGDWPPKHSAGRDMDHLPSSPPSLVQPLCSLPSFPISFVALFLQPWSGHDSSATLAPIPPLPTH